MAFKELVLPLEALGPPAQFLATGYYTDPTGQRYYYDATTGQWYRCSGFLLIPLQVAALAWSYKPWTGASLGNLNIGDSIRVTASFKYQGPAMTRNIRLSIFHYAKGTTPTGDMNEAGGANNTQQLTFGPYTTPTVVTAQAVLTIGSDCAGDDLGVYAKFTDVLTGFIYEQNCTYGFYGIGTVVPAAGVFSEFTISKVEKA